MHLSYLFLTQAFATIFLTGLIWMVQLVHYPAFLLVGQNEFPQFHSQHSARISLLVVPMMTLELCLAIVILFASIFEQLERKIGTQSYLIEHRLEHIQEMGWMVWVNVILVVLLWLVTFFVSVPLHNQLSLGYSEEAIQKLIHTNWIRTILWSIKSYVVLKILVTYYKSVNNLNP